jgi:mRNA-degrading endonuclease RelE of RelBE toxin-antitoxin system
MSLEFRIADTFTDSLARLTGDEQKAVKMTAFDLQLNPAQPGLKFHKLDRAKDKRFWSVRVNQDVRLIVHRSETSLLQCYVNHHDAAYAWAERRKLETHPTTGAAQLVELQETVREIEIPRYVEPKEAPRPGPAPARPLFAQIDQDQLLGYGVPPEWLERVGEATEATVLELATHLPAEAGEALLELAVGRTPTTVRWVGPEVDPFEHPDAQRRFRTVKDADKLAAALEYPWEKWTVFLHPAQRETVERAYSGPARISGTAGTGKTIVALHRAVFLAADEPDARVLLTTFSDALANALRVKLRRLLAGRPRLAERIDVASVDAEAVRLYGGIFGPPKLAPGRTCVAP